MVNKREESRMEMLSASWEVFLPDESRSGMSPKILF